ncbi:TPA: hypothetical protein VDB83_001172 [Burkholderia cenocepacia]|uniref:hypothetical protein n=1 Tax=Burkholderia cenocepacia TaxID=95486 RepID=UPI001B966127|nr:hypothetical protein [Burkholderia cenocepacia]MBR8096332.1 hypothetical protein [Burkholderia cenocepacia]HEP6426901.1 hypothetical protein [Burkholderia cenocepacia]
MAGQATLTTERVAQEQLRTAAGIRIAAALSEVEQKAAELKIAIARLQATTGSTTTNADAVLNAIKAQL